MGILDILGRDETLTLIGAAAAGLWGAFKSSEWYQAREDRRTERALHALEAGVEQTYRTYVRAIKNARADGRLTDVEMRHARQQALAAAQEYGRTQGVDVARTLGQEYLELWIAKLVARLKKG